MLTHVGDVLRRADITLADLLDNEGRLTTEQGRKFVAHFMAAYRADLRMIARRKARQRQKQARRITRRNRK